MKISFSTGSLYCVPLKAVFRLAAEAGFEGVELLVAPEVLIRGGAAVRDLARSFGLGIHVVHRGLLPVPGWKEKPGGMRRLVDLARTTGADTVVIHPPAGCRSLEDSVARRFVRTAAAAAEAGGDEVRVALENQDFRTDVRCRNPFTDPATLRRFAEDHGLALTLDTTHTGCTGHDLLEIYPHFRGRLRDLHLSDYRPASRLVDNRFFMNYLVQHQKPGEGVLPLKALLETLVAEGYVGNVSLEVGPVATRAWWLPALKRNLADMARFVREVRDGGRT